MEGYPAVLGLEKNRVNVAVGGSLGACNWLLPGGRYRRRPAIEGGKWRERVRAGICAGLLPACCRTGSGVRALALRADLCLRGVDHELFPSTLPDPTAVDNLLRWGVIKPWDLLAALNLGTHCVALLTVHKLPFRWFIVSCSWEVLCNERGLLSRRLHWRAQFCRVLKSWFCVKGAAEAGWSASKPASRGLARSPWLALPGLAFGDGGGEVALEP